MPRRIIEVLVSPQGETTITTRGYVGSECQRASRYLEQALGVPSREQLTAEFYEGVQVQQDVQQTA